eukprot:6483442-Amphidinium_carterae.1
MNLEETEMAMTAAAAATMSDHSTIPYTSSSGERSKPRGSILRAKSDSASRVTTRSAKKVKGSEVRLPLNVRVGRTASRLRAGPENGAVEEQLRIAECAYNELGMHAAREVSARSAELAASSAHVEQQNVLLQKTASELSVVQQRLSQVQIEATQRVNQLQVEAHEKVLAAEVKATSVERSCQGELARLRGELVSASASTGAQLDVAKLEGERSGRAQLEQLLREALATQHKQSEEMMSLRMEMRRMNEAHEAEKQNITKQAIEQIGTMGAELRALQQKQSEMIPNSGGSGGNMPVTLEHLQQMVAQQVAAQTQSMCCAGAPPPPPPGGTGSCCPPGLHHAENPTMRGQGGCQGGAPPPPPPPPSGNGGAMGMQDENRCPLSSGMSVHMQGHNGPPDGDPNGWPGDDSDGEDHRHLRDDGRRREAAKVELLEIPAAAGFRTWKTNAYREICGCSSDPQRAFTWLSEIDGSASDDEINIVRARWKSLDGKVAAALGRIMKGTLLRRVNTKIEMLARAGRFAAGRLVLRWLIQDFAVDNSRGALYDISDLMQLKLSGTSAGAIQHFLEAWTWVEQGLKSDVAPRVKEAMLWHQVKECHILEPELVLYRTAPEGSEWRNYEYLLRSIESYVKRHRQDATRDEVLKGIQNLGGGAGQAYPVQQQEASGADAFVAGGKREDQKKACWAWERGECKRGLECKFAHDAQKKGVRKRSVTPNRSSGSGVKPVCLAWSKTGQCSYGDRCRFVHDTSSGTENDKQCCRESLHLDSTPGCVGEMLCTSTSEIHRSEIEHVTTGVESMDPQCFVCSAHSVQRRWIGDSGAGVDLIGRKHVWASERETMNCDMGERKLRTANGITTANSSVTCEMESLNVSLNPLILDECPPVLSLGRRVAQGFRFTWDVHECALYNPNGEKVVLQVENYVPILVQEVPSHTADFDERLKHGCDACPGEDITGEAELPEPGRHGGTDAPSGAMEGENEEEKEEDDEEEELPSKMKYMQNGRVKDAVHTKIHQMIHFPRNKYCGCCRATRFQNKQARKIPMEERAVQAKHFGDMLHLDHVFVNSDFVGCHGERCALVIVDEATRFCFLYPAKEKSADNVINALRHFIGTDVEWQRINIKSDNAREYCKACHDLGVAWHESTPNRHESNGLVERLIRTVSDISRSILHQSGLGHPFWSIASQMAAMMMNMFVPNHEGEFPWQKRRGGKIFPHAASAFGARVRCIIPGKMADKRPKFMTKGSPCLFAGWHWAPGFVHADYQ